MKNKMENKSEEWQPDNIPEFQRLVERYETIQLDEIESVWRVSTRPKQKLTGFGAFSTCPLCTAADTCRNCVYGILEGCSIEENRRTYSSIVTAYSPKSLLTAYRARAKHLRATYPQYLNG